jgi:hypothetical protein
MRRQIKAGGFRVPKFELNRLVSYDDEALLAELRRIAALAEGSYLTKAVFDRHSKASSDVIRVRFGRWKMALERAGLRNRYSGTPDGKRSLAQASRSYSDDQLLNEIRTVAAKIGSKTVSRKDFDLHATMTSFTVHKRFGSWLKGLELAGLGLSKKQKKHTDEDYFENLLTVWTHYGRQPHYGEMQREPSTITASAYERKWRTWRKALLAFIDRVNSDAAEVEQVSPLANAVEEARPPTDTTASSRASSCQRRRSAPDQTRPALQGSTARSLPVRHLWPKPRHASRRCSSRGPHRCMGKRR